MGWPRALLATFAVGVLFLASMLWQTNGRLSMPVDDSFIYFQYARQAAGGEILQYQSGDAHTSGSTSLPWMALLTLASLLGLDGRAMVLVAWLLGGLALAATMKAVAAAQNELAPRKPGSKRPGELPILGLPLAAALVWLCGPLQWGAWSGMEIPLTTLAVAVAFGALCRSGGAPERGAALAVAGLALVRPEGALLALVTALGWGAQALWRRRGDGLVWALVPAAAAFVQPLFYALVTGSARSTGFAAKSILAAPHVDLVEAGRVALLRAASLGLTEFGGIAPAPDGRGLYAYEAETAVLWVVPGMALLFLVGVLPAVAREWNDRRVGPGIWAVTWGVVVLVATALIEEPDAHYGRYQMPWLPVFLLFAAIGVGRIVRVLRDQKAGFDRLGDGLRLWIAAWGAVSVLFFAGAYGHNCRDIDSMQIHLGERLQDLLEPGESVAINDAGALAYFSGRRTVDLIGLTSPGLAGLWAQGSGALWESLESMPAERRPGWFCIFPNWFDFDGGDFLRRKGSVRLLQPSIVDAEKVVYRADWSGAGSGDAPAEETHAAYPELSVIDRLDVADVASEAAHGFHWRQGGPGDAGTFLRKAPVGTGEPITDAGRTILHSAAFRVERHPDGPAVVVVRTISGARQRLLVAVDGGPEERVEVYAPGPGRFHEQAVAVLPAGSGPADVRLRVVPEAAESAPLVLAHVFALGPAR